MPKDTLIPKKFENYTALHPVDVVSFMNQNHFEEEQESDLKLSIRREPYHFALEQVYGLLEEIPFDTFRRVLYRL